MNNPVQHPDQIAEQVQRTKDYIRDRYGDRPIPPYDAPGGIAEPETTGDVREQIARAMCDTDAGEIGYSWDMLAEGEPTSYSGIADAYRRCADAVLALPAVRDALAAQETLRRLSVCPTLCDDDCDADCHEWHQPRYKRMHQPEHCPAALVAAALPGDS